MRDLVMLGAMVAVLPMALINGFVAFLLWIYTNLLSPHVLLYGFMGGFRYVFVFAVLALGAILLGRLKEQGRFLVDKPMGLLILFIVHTVVSSVLAWSDNPLVEFRIEYFIKGMALAVAAPLFLTSRWRLHMTIFAIVAGLGFHGAVDGLKMISSGGSHMIYGIPRSTLSDNNLYALGIVMLLPLILYLAKYSKNPFARWGFFVLFGLCIMTVLGSNSRGGFLAMAILCIWYWLTSSRKLLSTFVIAVVAIGVIQVAPQRWFDRIETIKQAGQDDSFLGRVAAWKVSINIANENPIFGVGFDATQVHEFWNKYKQQSNIIEIEIPESVAFKAAHSNYFQVLGDSGYLGLIIFLALLASAFYTGWRNNKLAKQLPGDSEWATDMSKAISLSLVAFMAGGAGVSLAYFELAYLQIAILSAINRYLSERTI